MVGAVRVPAGLLHIRDDPWCYFRSFSSNTAQVAQGCLLCLMCPQLMQTSSGSDTAAAPVWCGSPRPAGTPDVSACYAFVHGACGVDDLYTLNRDGAGAADQQGVLGLFVFRVDAVEQVWRHVHAGGFFVQFCCCPLLGCGQLDLPQRHDMSQTLMVMYAPGGVVSVA